MANDKKALLPLIVALVASLLCFCSPLPAFADEAEDDSPAYEVWTGYKDSSITEFNLYQKVVEDLSYRWFMASDAKRAKVPLQSVALGSYKQLSQYAEDYDTPDEQWQAFYDDFHPSYIVRMYSLVTYEDSMSTWGVSDSYAFQHYKEWYEWFEGSSSGGGSSTFPGAGSLSEDGSFVTVSNPSDGRRVNAISDSTNSQISFYLSSNYGSPSYTTCSGRLSGNALQQASEWLSQGYGLEIYQTGYGVFLVAFEGDKVQPDYRTNPYGERILAGLKNVSNQTATLKWMAIGVQNYGYLGSNGLYINATLSGGNLGATALGSGQSDPGYYVDFYLVVDGFGTQAPVDPEPVRPVYPEPDTPDLPTPSNPIYVDNDNTTTTADLTPILDALRRINTNIVTGFNAIEEDFTAFVEYFGEWQDTLWSELRSVNAWLERIFYKTGGGSSDGPDITIDGDGWWSWLSTIAGLLLGDLAGAVSGLAGAFDVLRGLFPFSVPWDLAALLGLFVSDPVTPVFDLPVPFGFANGDLQSASVHVDLSAWDNVMVAVRSVELAIFALGLALKTRELLKNAEVEQ